MLLDASDDCCPTLLSNRRLYFRFMTLQTFSKVAERLYPGTRMVLQSGREHPKMASGRERRGEWQRRRRGRSGVGEG